MEQFLHRARPPPAQISQDGGGILGIYLRDISSRSIALRGSTAKSIQGYTPHYMCLVGWTPPREVQCCYVVHRLEAKHNRPFWAGVGSNSLFFNLEYECVTIKLRISEKSDSLHTV